MFHPRRPPFRPLARALFVGYLFNNLRAYDVLSLVVLLLVIAPWLPPVNWLHAAGLAACVVPRRVAGGHRHGLSMILPASPAAVGVFEGATVVCPCSRR